MDQGTLGDRLEHCNELLREGQTQEAFDGYAEILGELTPGGSLAGVPRAARIAAGIHVAMGSALRAHGQLQDALEVLQLADDALSRETADPANTPPDIERVLLGVTVRSNRGNVLDEAGQAAEALGEYRQALERLDALPASAAPDVREIRVRLLLNFAITLGRIDPKGEVIGVYDRIIDACSHGLDSEQGPFAREFAWASKRKGDALAREGQVSPAEECYGAAVRTYEHLVLGPLHDQIVGPLASCCLARGNTQSDMGLSGPAHVSYDRAIALFDELAGAGDAEARRQAWTARYRQARAFNSRQEVEEAEALAAFLEELAQAGSPVPGLRPEALRRRGELLRSLKRHAECAIVMRALSDELTPAPDSQGRPDQWRAAVAARMSGVFALLRLPEPRQALEEIAQIAAMLERMPVTAGEADGVTIRSVLHYNAGWAYSLLKDRDRAYRELDLALGGLHPPEQFPDLVSDIRQLREQILQQLGGPAG